jgi:myo-inositol-1(or 4)-monophosphatase
MDLFWSYSTKIWDVAAASLVLREAGGVISATDGGVFELEDAHFLVAANASLHEQLQEIVRKALRPLLPG